MCAGQFLPGASISERTAHLCIRPGDFKHLVGATPTTPSVVFQVKQLRLLLIK